MKMVLARFKILISKVHITYSICDDYSAKADEIWMNGDLLYATPYVNFRDGGEAAQRSPRNNLTQ